MNKNKLCILLMSLGFVTNTWAMSSSLPTDRQQVVRGSALDSLPWSAVAHFKSEQDFDDAEIKCTAVFVSPRIAITAAHCVFSENTQSEGVTQGDLTGSPFTVTDQNGEQHAVIQWVTGTTYPQGSNPLDDLEQAKDWAILVLDADNEGDHGVLSVADSSLVLTATDVIQAAGYSDDVDNGDQLSVDSACHPMDQSTALLKTDCEFSEGASGGPDVYQDSSGKYWLVGIHSFLNKPQDDMGAAYSSANSYSASVPVSAFRAQLAQIQAQYGSQ